MLSVKKTVSHRKKYLKKQPKFWAAWVIVGSFVHGNIPCTWEYSFLCTTSWGVYNCNTQQTHTALILQGIPLRALCGTEAKSLPLPFSSSAGQQGFMQSACTCAWAITQAGVTNMKKYASQNITLFLREKYQQLNTTYLLPSRSPVSQNHVRQQSELPVTAKVLCDTQTSESLHQNVYHFAFKKICLWSNLIKCSQTVSAATV